MRIADIRTARGLPAGASLPADEPVNPDGRPAAPHAAADEHSNVGGRPANDRDPADPRSPAEIPADSYVGDAHRFRAFAATGPGSAHTKQARAADTNRAASAHTNRLRHAHANATQHPEMAVEVAP